MSLLLLFPPDAGHATLMFIDSDLRVVNLEMDRD